MATYSVFNTAIFILAGVVAFAFTRDRRSFLANVRVSLLVVLLGLPWDFFAIENGIWIYPRDPGPRIFTVPLNDLWFMFSCSLITATLIARFCLTTHAGGHAKPEECRDNRGQDE